MGFKMKMKAYGQGKSPIKFMELGRGGVMRGIFGGRNKNQNPNAAAAGAIAGVPQNPQNPNPQNPPVNPAPEQGVVGRAVNEMIR